MSCAALPKFLAQPARTRPVSAAGLYQCLRVTRPDLAACYDGDRMVALGPIEVRYLTRAVEISFPDRHDERRRVAVYVPGTLTFAPVMDVVEGLLSGWQVTT
jgi:hypothetical protein